MLERLKSLFRAIVYGHAVEKLIESVGHKLGLPSRRYAERFYLHLAVLFVASVAATFLIGTLGDSLQSRTYDLTIRKRLSSPRPDPRILIVEIDERSLAALGGEFGRWPWPRQVLAEVIAGLNDAGARSTILNVMLPDPDKANPDSDATFNDIAANTPSIAYPIVRLDAKNDALSQIKPSMLAGAHVKVPESAEKPLAVLFPFFTGTHDKLGMNQLSVDSDGVVRKAFPYLNEPQFSFSSMAMRAVANLGNPRGVSEDSFPKGMLINWRNKKGSYARMSFSDVYHALNTSDPAQLARFKSSIVIIGPTAPGISTLKATSASPLMDDNVIVATEVDDLLNGTYLRLIPMWATSAVAAIVVLLFYLGFARGVKSANINRYFVLIQSGTVYTAIGAASYTPYFVDLSAAFLFGGAYFAVAKIFSTISTSALRGHPKFQVTARAADIRRVTTLALQQIRKAPPLDAHIKSLERMFAVDRVFHVDNLFGPGHFLSPALERISLIVILEKASDTESSATGTGTLQAIEDQIARLGYVVREARLDVPGSKNAELSLRQAIARTALESAAKLL